MISMRDLSDALLDPETARRAWYEMLRIIYDEAKATPEHALLAFLVGMALEHIRTMSWPDGSQPRKPR
jgi:hypothetical protein